MSNKLKVVGVARPNEDYSPEAQLADEFLSMIVRDHQANSRQADCASFQRRVGPRRRLTCLAYVSVDDFERLRLVDEEAAVSDWSRFQMMYLAPLCELCDGRLVQELPGGVVLEFGDAVDAVDLAMRVQRLLDRRPVLRAVRNLRLRISVGFARSRDNDSSPEADDVGLVCRAIDLAAAGEIVISRTVHDFAADQLSIEVQDASKGQASPGSLAAGNVVFGQTWLKVIW